ncbi:MAG: Flp pilus assembly complex ATPase component TadA [Candidatus Buchananbacteria bacterium]|nr:Flp pilus assembly complex ATPase component TadA [Candidatus Buchananbacteria bacterium]
MIDDGKLEKILLETKTIGKKELDLYLEEAKKRNQSLEEYILSQKAFNEDQLYQIVAQYFNLPFINLKNETIRKDILFLIPEPIASTHKIAAFDRNEHELKIAALNPEDLQIFEFLSKKTDAEIKIHITTPSGINEALKNYHKGLKAEFQELTKDNDNGDENGDTKLKELAHDLPVIRIVDTLLEYAIFENASDIHIEPTEKEVMVRYRVDGILRNVMTLPKSVHAGIIARIKILSNLKLDEHRLPQDSRFKVQTNEYKVSFRVSIIPTYDGEKIVLRALNENTGVITLEQLGFQKKSFEAIKRNIEKPHGLILVTGPTGSGKTTTLYAILNILNRPEVNITTIEDPIEYRMPGLNQSQVNPKIGYTFASGLRSFLRQDPNIIMVGEIRDDETAEIAIHAALTGHLVLSTLHTNDAPTSLPRLSEMGVAAFLVASTTNVIIAQRLVRKICQDCIESYNLSKEELSKLEKQINLDSVLATLEKENLLTKKQSRESLLFYRGKGCKKCDKTGYKGRVGLYEVLEVNSEISNLITRGGTANEIEEAAKKNGMMSILEDGFIKAKTGITTIEEVLRVTKD